MIKRALLGLTLALSSFGLSAQNGPVDVEILAFNDFHGNLRPPASITIADPTDPTKTININAGGSEYLATLLRTFRSKNPNNITVAAGDLIGASPLLSSLFHDEPTIEAMNLMELDLTSVGNHEFDKGKDELLRMQTGGCHPTDGCKSGKRFDGARFKYLAANVVSVETGRTLFPAYEIRKFGGIPVAFVGVTLKATPTIVAPSGLAGLEFSDEADTVNRLVPGLKAQGVEAIVVLVHEGGRHTGGYDDCKGFSGVLADVVKRFDTAVDVVVSGHTHQAYNCTLDGKLVTSAAAFGRFLTEIDLKLDPRTHDVIAKKAENVIVHDGLLKDRGQSALIDRIVPLVAPLENRAIGSATSVLSIVANPAGESSLGDIIADAELEATRDALMGGAQIAFMNSGGIRAAIQPVDGTVTYGQLFATQPFGDNIITMSIRGSDIDDLLEQQWSGGNERFGRVLQVSSGFTYTWDAAKPGGQRVDPVSIRLNGTTVVSDNRYRVAVNDFLTSGGDNFTVLTRGTDLRGAGQDLDVLEKYFKAHAPVAPGPQNRIQRLN